MLSLTFIIYMVDVRQQWMQCHEFNKLTGIRNIKFKTYCNTEWKKQYKCLKAIDDLSRQGICKWECKLLKYEVPPLGIN